MMKFIREIKKDLEEINQILFKVNHFYWECKFLYTTQDKIDVFHIKRFSLFRIARVSLLTSIVLDLNTLFNPDEDFSLNTFLNKIINNNKRLKAGSVNFSLKELRKMKESVDLAYPETVKNLRIIRNQHYAHLDSKRGEINDYMPSFEEFEVLIELANRIMRTSHSIFNDSDIFYDPIIPGSDAEEIMGLLKDRWYLYEQLERGIDI